MKYSCDLSYSMLHANVLLNQRLAVKRRIVSTATTPIVPERLGNERMFHDNDGGSLLIKHE